MGTWLTKEERLEYHRGYNGDYRKDHPDKIKQYRENEKKQIVKTRNKNDAIAAAKHRLEDLKEEYDEGNLI